jgi:2'-5' RNA ligase
MRLFIAINPSAEERARLGAACRKLREGGFPVRWVAPESVHLTLKFLGEVAESRLPELEGAVNGAAAGTGAFDMAVADFGAFPSLRRPQVVWSGVEVNATLAALQERVEAALAELGFPREARAFKPHLTLGRAQKHARPPEFRGLEDVVGNLSYKDVFRVRSVDVMRSRLMPTGALYDVMHSAAL